MSVKKLENSFTNIYIYGIIMQIIVLDMLKKFQVENYRGFKNALSWDLSDTAEKNNVTQHL